MQQVRHARRRDLQTFAAVALRTCCWNLADRRPVRVAALQDVRVMSLRYAGHLPVCTCIPCMIVHSLKSIRQLIDIRNAWTNLYQRCKGRNVGYIALLEATRRGVESTSH